MSVAIFSFALFVHEGRDGSDREGTVVWNSNVSPESNPVHCIQHPDDLLCDTMFYAMRLSWLLGLL